MDTKPDVNRSWQQQPGYPAPGPDRSRIAKAMLALVLIMVLCAAAIIAMYMNDPDEIEPLPGEQAPGIEVPEDETAAERDRATALAGQIVPGILTPEGHAWSGSIREEGLRLVTARPTPELEGEVLYLGMADSTAGQAEKELVSRLDRVMLSDLEGQKVVTEGTEPLSGSVASGRLSGTRSRLLVNDAIRFTLIRATLTRMENGPVCFVLLGESDNFNEEGLARFLGSIEGR